MADPTEIKKEKQGLYDDVYGILEGAHKDLIRELLETGNISEERLKALGGGLDAANKAILATIASLMADAVMEREIYRNLPHDELRKKMPDIFDEVRNAGLKKIILDKSNLMMITALAMIDPTALAQSAKKSLDQLVELTIIEVERRRATK